MYETKRNRENNGEKLKRSTEEEKSGDENKIKSLEEKRRVRSQVYTGIEEAL